MVISFSSLKRFRFQLWTPDAMMQWLVDILEDQMHTIENQNQRQHINLPIWNSFQLTFLSTNLDFIFLSEEKCNQMFRRYTPRPTVSHSYFILIDLTTWFRVLWISFFAFISIIAATDCYHLWNLFVNFEYVMCCVLTVN